MIRSSILPSVVRSTYPIVVRTLPKAMAATGGSPFSALLKDNWINRRKMSGQKQHLFSTTPRAKHEEEISNGSYSDEFDESDALEMVKNHAEKKNVPVTRVRYRPVPFPSPFFKILDMEDWLDPWWKRRRFPHDKYIDDDFVDDFSVTTPPRTAFPKIRETEDAYFITIDIPKHLESANVKVEMKDNQVLVSGKRETNKKGMASTTRFEKRFSVGQTMNPDQMTANHLVGKGLLELKVPKAELKDVLTADKTKEIPITHTNV